MVDSARRRKLSFGRRLAAERARHNWTAADAARAVNRTRQHWAMWEAGVSMPAGATVADLARALGVSSDYLLGLTDRRDPPVP